jgi:AraC-like DNA-binding protein
MKVAPGVWMQDSLEFAGLRFEEIRYEAGHHHGMHSHGSAFLDLSLGGLIRGRWKGTDHLRTPASVTYLPIGEPHAIRQDETTWTFQVVMPEPWLRRLREVQTLHEDVCLLERDRTAWATYRLFAEFKRRDSLTPLALEERLQALLIGAFGQEPSSALPPSWLGKVETFLHDRFLNPMTPEEIAQTVGIHPAYLMRAFRRHRGRTLGDYVRELRVAHACRLLTGPLPLAEVALETGFADQSHFNRAFRAYVGMTPLEYRRMAR